MYLCTIDIAPRSPGQVVAAEVEALSTALCSSGQLIGSPVVGRSQDGYRIAGLVPRSDSLETEHRSRAVQRSWHRLLEVFGADIEIEVEQHDEPVLHTSSLDVANELYLVVYSQRMCAPLLADTGLFVPSYLLPIDDDERVALFSWARERRCLLELESISAELERAAALAVSSAHGAHADTGRALCRRLEAATARPVFYTLYCPIDMAVDMDVCSECRTAFDVRVGPFAERLRVCGSCRLALSE